MCNTEDAWQMTKTRVLIVTDSLDVGGIETYIHGVCKTIDKKTFHVIVFVLDKERNALAKDIEAFGCHVVFATARGKLRQMQEMMAVARRHAIDIVHFQVRHSHLMLAAKVCGKKVILHSHFGSWQKSKNPIKAVLMKAFLWLFCDVRLACSEGAGENAFYGHDFVLAKNGIDMKKFAFNESKRLVLRKKHRLVNKKILLQVGRCNSNKNQLFSIKVLHELRKRDDGYVLVLAGDDGGRDYIDPTIQSLDLEEYIVMLGNVDNISDYYSFADVFLLPSFSEGFPMTVIEAQVSGVDCIVSDTVTKKVGISDAITFASIHKSPSIWVDIIMNRTSYDRKVRRVNDTGYDLSVTVPALEDVYKELARS